MKKQNSLALVVAYYLSRYDKAAYDQLGYRTKTGAHEEIGRILGVNPNSVKNMRDEFDPLHDNTRAGWHQRGLRPSRKKVFEAFGDMSEMELHDVVVEILKGKNPSFVENLGQITEMVTRENEQKNSNKQPVFAVRGPTGRKAEEFFMEYHGNTGLPVEGHLADMRDMGCGYDFEISSKNQTVMVEVKGLDGHNGGISFTSKEWETARKNGESYFLAVIRNISDKPDIQIIRNPAHNLSPQKAIIQTLQVRWNVTTSDLRQHHHSRE